jgi:hypothetical protein
MGSGREHESIIGVHLHSKHIITEAQCSAAKVYVAQNKVNIRRFVNSFLIVSM